MQKSVLGYCQLGYFRLGVINIRYERISQTHANGGIGVEVTRRKRQLNPNRDSTTGWKTSFFIESTVTGVWTPRGASPQIFLPGTYVRYDVMFVTLDPMLQQDQNRYNGELYEVKSVENHVGPHGGFAYRVCQLRKLPLYRLG